MTHEQMTKLSKECNHNIESLKKYIGLELQKSQEA